MWKVSETSRMSSANQASERAVGTSRNLEMNQLESGGGPDSHFRLVKAN